MGGALEYGNQQGWDFAELVKRAIEAGNDQVMLSRTPAFNGTIWNRLMSAYETEPAFAARVDESVRRVLRLKIAYLRPETRVPLEPDPDRIRTFMRSVPSREFFLDQAGRSITLVRDEGIPYQPTPDERILLVGKDNDFFRVGRRFFPGAAVFRFENNAFYFSSAGDRRRLQQVAPRYDTVIFLLSDPNSAEMLAELSAFDGRVIAYSILTPIYLADFPWIRTALAVYGWGVESFEAGFAAIRGDYRPSGRLPISLDAELDPAVPR
jgi:beta-N-acetylhexosaminidase